jgi:RNA exonuclease 1
VAVDYTVNFFACFRFSGITEEDMIGVQTSIYDVQATLLSFIHDRTNLLGHSLDSDLKALKVGS